MNTQHYLAPLLGAALLVTTGSANVTAQTWDTFVPVPDDDAGIQVLIDPFSANPANPSVFVGSMAGTILRMEPLDASTYQPDVVDKNLAQVRRMGFNPTDSSVYALGERLLVTTAPFPRNNPYVWIVRRSSFNSVSQAWSTWTDSDKFYLSSTEAATAYSFASDPAGNLYACGSATLKGWPHWIVRRKLASGGSWTTIADSSAKSTLTAAYGACFYPGNPSANLPPALFVTGILSGKWIVQRLEANGTWTTVDNAPLSGGANSITYDANGTLYVVGYRLGPVSDIGGGWVIRTNSAGGAAGSWWTALDTKEGFQTTARHVAADMNGNVWVSGLTGSTTDIQTSVNRWTVMRSSQGHSWADSWNNRQHPFDGISSVSGARGIATDVYGNVFITGVVSDLTAEGSTMSGRRIVLQRLVTTP